MRCWGDKKGPANTLVLPYVSGGIGEACIFRTLPQVAFNLSQGCVPLYYSTCYLRALLMSCLLLRYILGIFLSGGIVTLITLLLCGKKQLMEHDDSLVVAYFQLVTQSSIICLVNKGYIVSHSQGFVLK